MKRGGALLKAAQGSSQCLGLPLLPEHEAQRGGQHGVEQVGEQATARTSGGRRTSFFATTLHCWEEKNQEENRRGARPGRARRANEKARPGHSTAMPARALARRKNQTVSDWMKMRMSGILGFNCRRATSSTGRERSHC